ncbi:MAG: TRAP transporter large permease [Hyphomicrobiales bacterium]|nr:TRAP transporter large permease [Hyphomicrobiales bacterium]
MLVASVGFLCAFALIFLRVPVAIALAVVGFGGFAIVNGFTPALSMITLVTSGSTMSYPLAVIPLFILMGNFVAGGGISAQLYRAAQAFIGHWRGGLALATIVSCGGFAAVCGSSVATAVTMGKVCIPSMRRYGYSESLSTATVAAGGTLGILIPPSVIMVVYGVQTQTHIGKLFAAGLLPGLIGIIGYSLAIRWTVFRKPQSAPAAERSTRAEKMSALMNVWPVAALFVLVLGGIYTGYFTATEAGGIGAIGALAFALFRGLSLTALLDILKDSVQTTAVLFALILGATIFGEFINLTGADRAVLALVSNSSFPPWLVVLIIMLIYVLLGCVLDSLAMILLTLPMFFPIIIGLGYDPVWFGIFVVMLVELGLITPPIGMNLFVLSSVAPDIRLKTIISGILPFIVSDICRILLVAFFPIIALVLPNLFF